MLDEKYLYIILKDEVSELEPILLEIPDIKSPYYIALCFAGFTRSLIVSGELKKAFRCLKLAESFWKEGNRSVRNAIENVFLFSIAEIICSREEMIEQLPPLLKAAYKKQTVLLNPSVN